MTTNNNIAVNKNAIIEHHHDDKTKFKMIAKRKKLELEGKTSSSSGNLIHRTDSFGQKKNKDSGLELRKAVQDYASSLEFESRFPLVDQLDFDSHYSLFETLGQFFSSFFLFLFFSFLFF